MPMLCPLTRQHYATLGDAALFRPGSPGSEEAPAVAAVATGRPPLVLSRAVLRRRIDHRRRALDRLGIRPGHLVIVALEEPVEVLSAFWGAVLLGAVPTVHPPPDPRALQGAWVDGVAAAARRLGAAAVVAPDGAAAPLAANAPCPVHAESRLAAPPDTTLGGAPKPSRWAGAPTDLAYVQTSSGTTGARKAVPITHAMLLSQMAAYTDRLPVTGRDVIVNWMPLHHDGGLILGAILPLVQGIPAVLMSPIDWVQHPALLLRAIHDFRGTLCTMPNFAFGHLARACRPQDIEGVSLASMRGFINGSERVFAASFDRFLARFAGHGITPDRLAVAYGLAENTLMATHGPIGLPPRLDHVDRVLLETRAEAVAVAAGTPGAAVHVSCGPPLPGTRLAIQDGDHRSLPERAVGEVAIQSDCLFGGYYLAAEPPPGAFSGDWFLTGDLGYVAAGELYIVGRKKDLIITGGRNIHPADLEEVVGTVPGVRPGRVVAFGVPDEEAGTELITVVAELARDDPAGPGAIEASIRRALVERAGVVATHVDLRSERWIVKTSSGKLARDLNRRRWLADRPPATPAGREKRGT